MSRRPREQVDYLHLEELGGLEMLKASYFQQEFSRHVHEGFCIGVIEEGAQRFYRTGGNHVAPQGDIILVNADEVHTGSSAVETGWRYRAIYPTPEIFHELTRDLTNIHGTAPWFREAVLHDEGLAQQLRLLFDLLEQPSNTLLKQTLFLSTIAWLISKYSQTKPHAADLSNAKQRILNIKELMASMPEQEFSLIELAEMANLSQWHFLRQFKKHVGLSPHAWLIQARLQKSQKLLRQGLNLSEISQQCGFSDQSHFSRHFRQTFRITPGGYIAYLK
ncbi:MULTISPECIES: AraC family transcriptional regulator [Acinetobacter]|uniref:AraC family transcriptional regulator n=1 Tax=Acinetobacter junii TaxID=40215 RepID=A0A365PI20_ACIJU|nr:MULTISPECIES: AraC family transcriptional regulator [Acinetobacter]RBA39309.1 AraC family transcriptional regulator [Acinetobacter junii]RBA41168.1 AraC family transcriptional regulator [Acinetobacter junii]RBA45448.1 AraC family transcriptional regulator [Acinetobacter junii]WLF72777.1 AraC family transcriptional regulator [Acinetobacter junii]